MEKLRAVHWPGYSMRLLQGRQLPGVRFGLSSDLCRLASTARKPPPKIEERTTVFTSSSKKRSGLLWEPDTMERLAYYNKERADLFKLSVVYSPPKDFNYELPKNDVPEVAFVGRSNVGKSSLIEALLGSKGLLRISKEPGCTTTINYYALTRGSSVSDHSVYVLDMPGYGFARASKDRRDQWVEIMKNFLVSRGQLVLRRVFILVDARRGLKQEDLDTAMMLNEAVIPFQFILTKKDLVSKPELSIVLHTLFDVMRRSKLRAFYPYVHALSSLTGEGMDDFRLEVASVEPLSLRMSDILSQTSLNE